MRIRTTPSCGRAAEQTLGFTRRRQAHEALEPPAWAEFTSSGSVISLEATDTADTWLLALGRLTGTSTHAGTTYDEPTIAVLAGDDPSPVDAVVRGTAGDLDRWLWNRVGAGLEDRVERSGGCRAGGGRGAVEPRMRGNDPHRPARDRWLGAPSFP